METNPEQIFEISPENQFDNKENIVLRSITGDPNRHTPLVEHQPPSELFPQQKQPASMYTLETRYQPIPPKVLPKTTDFNRTESPIMSKNRETIIPTAFLEPKIISQPVFYSIGGVKTPPLSIDQPISINQEPPSPIIYSINGRPRRATMDMSVNNLDAPPPVNPLTDGSNLQDQPLKRSPHFYSIIGSPARTSRGVQVDTLDSLHPQPILYTVVGDTPIQTERSNEKHQPTVKQQPKDVIMYTLGGKSNALKLQQQQHPKDVAVYTIDNGAKAIKAQQQQQQPTSQHTVYALVDKPNSPPHENRAKPSVRKNSPPLTTTTNRRASERKQEIINEEIVAYPITKTKEAKVPKAETIYVPLNGQEQRTRPRQPPPTINVSSEQTQRKPYTITQYQPTDNRPPYTNRSTKPYRERKYNNNPLPVISNNSSERKARPPLYEPRYRPEQRHPYTPAKPTSLERYPVNTKPRSTLWDNGYQTQTDDDEEYEQRMNKKKQNYKTARSRVPWIPVW